MRRVIRLGDPTSHGGKVASAAGNYSMMGKNVARVGDICTCPIKGHNNCTIAEGDPNWTIDGRAVALEGHKTSCGAVLISTLGNVTRSYEGDGEAGGNGLHGINMETASAIDAPEQYNGYDQHFLLLNDQTGKPLEYVRYRIVLSNGDFYEGVSDGEGRTRRVYSDSPLQADIEVFV